MYESENLRNKTSSKIYSFYDYKSSITDVPAMEKQGLVFMEIIKPRIGHGRFLNLSMT